MSDENNFFQCPESINQYNRILVMSERYIKEKKEDKVNKRFSPNLSVFFPNLFASYQYK